MDGDARREEAFGTSSGDVLLQVRVGTDDTWGLASKLCATNKSENALLSFSEWLERTKNDWLQVPPRGRGDDRANTS